jgi:YVTN family beta-propeller protein
VVTPDGKSVLVANTASNAVATINIASNTITALTAVGNYAGLLRPADIRLPATVFTPTEMEDCPY